MLQRHYDATFGQKQQEPQMLSVLKFKITKYGIQFNYNKEVYFRNDGKQRFGKNRQGISRQPIVVALFDFV